MNLAIVVPVGPIDRMGYQHVWEPCRESWEASADKVFVVETLPRFGRTPDGSPWFDAYIVMEAVNDGVRLAGEREMDAALVLMCNNYVPDAALLREQAERMLVRGQPWNWYYRADQLAGELFGPSVRLPWLVNLRAWMEMRFSVDCLVANGDMIRMERGNYDEPPLVVDCQLEMTREELAEKMTFIRCYSDLAPKRRPVFEWGYWFPYYVDKFKRKRRLGGPLTETGKAIAHHSRPEFVSWEVLACL